MTPYRPIWLTVLPRERRSRHPYQLAPMLALIIVGLSQLIVGPVETSQLRKLPGTEDAQLSWAGILIGVAGILAAVIPERIVSVWVPWRRGKVPLDFTWMRLWVELGCHGAIITVWLSYFTAIQITRPLSDGLSITTALMLTLMPAACMRCAQISYTIYRAIFAKADPSAIVAAPKRDES